METSEIAALFVDLAFKYDWSKVKELPDAETWVLFETVSAAGFKPARVAPGRLVGHYLDQDGSRTGRTYPINGYCPYKVISRDGDDHHRATGWLDRAVSLARSGSDREERVKAVQHEIERSVPMNPIQLTVEGDMLREYPPSVDQGYFADHTRDGDTLSSCVGIHAFCGGWADRKRATEIYDAVLCRLCHLRILFPKEIKTYGQLRGYLESRLKVSV